MFGRWKKRREADRPAIDREAVHAAIEARLIEAIAKRTDVTYLISGGETDAAGDTGFWWIEIVAGEAEAEIMAAPDGNHMVTVDEYGYFERPLDGDLLAPFIREL